MIGTIDIDTIRTDYPVSSVVGAMTKLHRAGREWKACCPIHADRTPSFTIYAGDQRWDCFGCGEGGDVLDFVRKLHGVGLREAAGMLTGSNLPVVAMPRLDQPTDADRNTILDAAEIWRNSGAIGGTAAVR